MSERNIQKEILQMGMVEKEKASSTTKAIACINNLAFIDWAELLFSFTVSSNMLNMCVRMYCRIENEL